MLTASALAGCTASASDPEPDASPSPTADESAVPLLADQTLTELEPGPYALQVGFRPSHRYMPVLTVPEGYASIDREGFGIASTGDLDQGVDGLLWVWDLEEIYSHPCDASGTPQPVGPTVEDVAQALAVQPLRAGTAPEPVTIGGYEGFYVELRVPDDLDVTSCPTGRFNSWPGRWMQVGGQVSMVWVVDVDGQQITFEASYGPSADPANAAEMRAMVEGATFIPAEST
jgi:hypothetical protein